MKNQYIGDIGDYGKYGLLRYLSEQGVRIGINWYLTPDDGRTDGNHTEYLHDDRMRTYDAVLYDSMGHLAFIAEKSIHQVEQAGILDSSRFFHEPMDFDSLHWCERADARLIWHHNAMDVLKEADLVFADPDNGLSANKKPSTKGAQKYILPDEIVDYFTRGQDVVYYHHRSRKNAVGWSADKQMMRTFLPEAQLMALSFNRWACRTYIFVLHKENCPQYQALLNQFLHTAWGSYQVDQKSAFIREPI